MTCKLVGYFSKKILWSLCIWNFSVDLKDEDSEEEVEDSSNASVNKGISPLIMVIDAISTGIMKYAINAAKSNSWKTSDDLSNLFITK